MIYPTLHCKRVAVRQHNESWQWFGPPVHFTLRGFFEYPKCYTAMCVLESLCESAIKEYPMEDMQIVEAPSEDAYTKIDMKEL